MMPPSTFQSGKGWLVNNIDLAKDALHIYVALGLFFASCWLFRWPVRSWKPWTVVLVAAFAGEAWDLRDSMVAQAPVNLGASWHDVWNTLVWPSVIVALARLTRVFEH